MKLHICKSVDLSQNQEAWYTRIINGITQIVIPKAIISSNRVDVQGDKMSDCFLDEAFRVVEKIVVNEEHNSDLNVGHIENITHKWDEGLVVGDIVVENPDAIEKVKSGQYKALSIEGFGKTFKMLADGTREILTGVVNAVALTANPANKDAFFAKSDNSDIPEAVEVKDKDNTDTNLSKSDTPAPEASTDAQSQAVDTQTATDTQKAVEPADKQADVEPGQEPAQDTEVSGVDANELQVQVIKDLEAQLEEAKKKLLEKEAELAKSLEETKTQLEKSAQTAQKKLENENYVLKLSVANAKKAEEAHNTEIASLKKSLDEANAKVAELEKQPILKKGIHNLQTVNVSSDEDVIDDEDEVTSYLVFDKDGNVDKKKTLAKALSLSVKKSKITD